MDTQGLYEVFTDYSEIWKRADELRASEVFTKHCKSGRFAVKFSFENSKTTAGDDQR